ncbi:SEFIR domain-containing protein [Pseudomonas fragi]|uniref:SEFIR domain-containing protein n=1 Tax=Pseudomonas fragi TaxID=296 RepID=UPI0020061AC9|nr:SEFIR domain-containing protein [Pseudomonas fragi]MCK6252338.1 TIR domain-containing protein [Pseudomonas fragi]
MQPIKVFITYSWDSEDHKKWVQALATDLDEYEELHVTVDVFDLDNFSDKNHFMEKAVQESDIIIVVSTEKYRLKADDRTGGVGIETYLTTIRHWEESDHGGTSKIIVASREPYSTPFYLKGKFRVDFHNDDLYQKSLSFLLKALTGTSRVSRPEKRKSIEHGSQNYTFTRAEDILKLKHSKRRAIIDVAEGTDFSVGNRIKYELWEIKNPFASYVLILHSNITITQTINRFCQVLRDKGIVINELTLLRPAKGDESFIQKIVEKNGFEIKIAELTFSEFIWEYCIDEGLRVSSPVRTNKFYTDQTLLHISDANGPHTKSESAINFLTDRLINEATTSGQLVIATGGMGKSTLCHELAIALDKKLNSESSVILIKAESLRNNFSSELLSNIEIKTLYDLYDLHTQINKLESVYDRNQFELCLLCGRIIIIIDGLDEFASILQERFDLVGFLTSIHESHQQMGKSQVLLTSRNMSFIDNIALDEVGIHCHELLGFDEASRAKYIRKRFNRYEKTAEITELFDRYIQQMANFGDQHKRIVPFFIDIISTIFEEQLETKERISFEISSEDKDYACNSTLTDLIIFSVLRREKTRHDIELETKEFIDLLSELAVEHGEAIPLEKLREKLTIYYDDSADALYSKVVINPLLIQEGEILRFRYQFLNEYFKSLYVIAGILRSSFSKDIIQCLANTKSADQQSVTDVTTYFTQNGIDKLHSSAKEMIRIAKGLLLRANIEPKETESIKKAIGSLLNIYSRCGQYQRNDLSRKIRDIYQLAPDLDVDGKIEGLFVYGDFPSLDFSNLQVWDSGFFNYENFVTSKFTGTKFFYSEFSNTGGTYTSDSFDPAMFDSTCKLGELTDTVAFIERSAKSNKALCESELKKFLRGFYKGSSFIDQKIMYMSFSDKVEKLGRRHFDMLIRHGLVALQSEKKGDKFYVISVDFQDSVFKFLSDNFADGRIRSLIGYLKI